MDSIYKGSSTWNSFQYRKPVCMRVIIIFHRCTFLPSQSSENISWSTHKLWTLKNALGKKYKTTTFQCASCEKQAYLLGFIIFGLFGTKAPNNLRRSWESAKAKLSVVNCIKQLTCIWKILSYIHVFYVSKGYNFEGLRNSSLLHPFWKSFVFNLESVGVLRVNSLVVSN